jgi:hypothetical protein
VTALQGSGFSSKILDGLKSEDGNYDEKKLNTLTNFTQSQNPQGRADSYAQDLDKADVEYKT